MEGSPPPTGDYPLAPYDYDEKSHSCKSFKSIRDSAKSYLSNNNLKIQLILSDTPISYLLEQFATICIPNLLLIVGPALLILISFHFLGLSNNKLYYAAFGIGFSYFSVSGLIICQALIFGFYTFISNCQRNENVDSKSLFYQRANVILKICCLLFGGVQFLCYPVLKLLFGYSNEMAYHSGLIAISFIPMLILLIHFMLVRQFMASYQIFSSTLCIQYLMLILHYVGCWYFTYKLGLYYFGIAISTAICIASGIASIYIYLKITETMSENFQPWSWDAFTEWGNFFKNIGPTLVAIFIEFGGIEISNLFIGKLGLLQASVISVFMNIEIIFSGIAYGMGLGTGILIAAHLNEGEKISASRYFKTGLLLTFGFIAIIAIVLFIAKKYISRFYIISLYFKWALLYNSIILIMNSMKI